MDTAAYRSDGGDDRSVPEHPHGIDNRDGIEALPHVGPVVGGARRACSSLTVQETDSRTRRAVKNTFRAGAVGGIVVTGASFSAGVALAIVQ